MITGINHITLSTRNLEKSLDFYHDLLGFQLIATWKTGAYLAAGSLWLCLTYDENTQQQESPEYSHIAFTIDKDNFKKISKKISHANIYLWKENKSEGDSIYLLDPDFHKLELHCTGLKERLEHMQHHPYQEMRLFVTSAHLEVDNHD